MTYFNSARNAFFVLQELLQIRFSRFQGLSRITVGGGTVARESNPKCNTKVRD